MRRRRTGACSPQAGQRHNAHITSPTVRIYYPWHPFCGRELPLLKRYRRLDAFCVRLPDETNMILPAWMCDAGVCAGLRELTSPCIALGAWRRLRCLLDEYGRQLPAYAAASSPTPDRSSAAQARARRAGTDGRIAISDAIAGHRPARATGPVGGSESNSTPQP